MKSCLNLLYAILIFVYASPVEAICLDKHPVFKDSHVDSIAISILPEIFTSKSITRDDFDSWKKICTEITLRDKSEIQKVLDAFKQCVIDSMLPHNTSQVVKKMKILKRNDSYYTIWFNDDRLDIRCRVIFFCEKKVFVAWITGTGLLDFDTFRCSNGQIVLSTIKELISK